MLDNCKKKEIANAEFKSESVSTYVRSLGIIDDGSDWKRIAFVKDGQEDHDLQRRMDILKRFAYITMVTDFRVQRLQHRSEVVLKGLLSAIVSDEERGRTLLPLRWTAKHQPTSNGDADTWQRIATDYISGMTDGYANRVYKDICATGDPTWPFVPA